MKNKKKTLNPLKFWSYTTTFPTLGLTNFNYSYYFIKTTQVTMFMENLNFIGINLLIKQAKQCRFKRNRLRYYFWYLYYFKIYIFILYKKKKKVLKVYTFYITYLQKLSRVKFILYRMAKKDRAIKIRRKKFKEKFFRMIPKIFNLYYHLKSYVLQYPESQQYIIYILSPISIKEQPKNIRILDYYLQKFKLKTTFKFLPGALKKNLYQYLKKTYLFNEKIYWILRDDYIDTVKNSNLKIFFFRILVNQSFYFIQYFLLKKLVSWRKRTTQKLLKKIQLFFSCLVAKKVGKKKFFFFLFRFLFFKVNRRKGYFYFLRYEFIKLWAIYQYICTKTTVKITCLQKFKDFQLLHIPKANISGFQKTIGQLLYLQKNLENTFSKFFNYQVLVRIQNLFLSQKKPVNLNTMLKRLDQKKQIQKKNFFLTTIQVFLTAFHQSAPLLIAQHIAERLAQTGRRQKHSQTISQIFYILRLMKTIGFDSAGFQILICGKINAKTQTKVKYLVSGKHLQTNSFNRLINYNHTQAITYTGSFGIHVWLIK